MKNHTKHLGRTVAALSITLFMCSLTPEGKEPLNGTRDDKDKINSRYGGVQIGTITYSFRSIRDIDEVIQACADAGLSSVELMGTGIEAYLGAPENPLTQIRMRANDKTTEEKEALVKYRAEVQAWRADPANMQKYAQLRKKFNGAGVNIHIYKWVAGMSDEELDYSFRVARILGAIGITAELGEENCRLVGAAAERAGMVAIFHNHFQFAEEGFDVDALLAMSPANRLNFDIGHYYGSTGKNPAKFIEKYHDRIASLHLKDKTRPDNETEKNTNQVWGQGETPIAEVLELIQKNQWPIHCDIELEYKVKPWSDPVREVNICRAFCRQILL